MNSAEIIALLCECEKAFPVERWSVEGIHVWPIARMRWYNLLLHHDLGTGAEGAGARSGGGFLRETGRTLVSTMRNSLVDFGKNARPRPQDEVILLSDGVSLAKVDGEWFDRFMDPIITALSSEGRNSLLLMPLAAPATPRHTASIMVQPRLDAAKVHATIRTRLKRPVDHDLEGLEEILAVLCRQGGDLLLPARAWLIAQAARISAMAGSFDRLIGKTRARLAFVNTYYSADGMAFVLAARRRGCITIDVQHGAQVDHIAYHHWSKVPAGGYELLPQIFWCWGAQEVAAIDASFGSAGPHQAIEAGNLWWRAWTRPDTPTAIGLQKSLAELKARCGAPHHVLVTHTWGHPDTDWKTIVHAMAQSPENLFWWVRLHPMQVEQREQFKADLRQAGVKKFELDMATDYPLPVLIDHMDVNITQSSSTVIEAATLGIPSVITTRHGADLFAKEIEAGHSRFSDQPSDILAAITDLIQAGRFKRQGGIPSDGPDLLRCALAHAFARAGNESCRP